MKLDAHVHTHYSGFTSLRPLHTFLRESYNTPEGVYARSKQLGMDLVAITDHDTIDGALSLADRDDVIVGCEVTACFPSDEVRVHLNVLDITPAQFVVIDQLRHDICRLLPYLREQQIFTTLNHPASRVNGPVTAAHLAAVMPWVDGVEVRNGSRLVAQNRTAAALAEAYRKVPMGGSDAHTMRGVGRTCVVAERATSRAEFMRDLRAGRVHVEGRHGNALTMCSDVLRFASNFYVERATLLCRGPLNWRNHAFVACGVLGLPLVALPLVLSVVHFVLEERFNENLLFDLVAQPSSRLSELA